MSPVVVLVPMAYGTKLIVSGRVVAIGNDHRRIARMATANADRLGWLVQIGAEG